MIADILKTFVTAAECLSFTKAARELYITQPTVSRQIGMLEARWGLQLFQRGRNGVTLTQEGAVMLETCRKMEEDYAQGLEKARGLAGGITGSLKIGVLAALDEWRLLMPSLDSFGDIYPNVRLTLEKAPMVGLREGLRRGDYDVVFTLDTLNLEEQALKHVMVKRIERVPCYFVLSSRHPLYDKQPLEIQDLEHARFVLPDPTVSPNRTQELRELLAYCGLKDNEIVYEPNMDSLMLNLNSGRSVTILSQYANHVFDPGYRRLLVPEPPGRELCTVAVWKEDNRNPAISLLV